MIAKGAEAKVYYKSGDTSVIKERTSIYATLGKAMEAIVLHNALFPETPMSVIGFTRDSDGLFRIILTQPYIACQRLLATDCTLRICTLQMCSLTRNPASQSVLIVSLNLLRKNKSSFSERCFQALRERRKMT